MGDRGPQITDTRATPEIAPGCFYAGVAVVACATLMLQLIMTRLLSLVVWYHLAFFAISIAMFGMTAGAVWVYLRGRGSGPSDLAGDLSRHATIFALTSVLSACLLITLAPAGLGSLTALVAWFELSVAMAIPYFHAGIVVSLALTRSPLPVPRVYGADMIGAALGCLAVLLVLNLTDAVSAMLWTAALAGAAGLLFRLSGAPAARSESDRARWTTGLRRSAAVLTALVVIALVNSAFEFRLRPLMVKGMLEVAGEDLLFERWNSFSRVALFRHEGLLPHMWGPSPRTALDRWPIEQYRINIDGLAGTTMFRRPGAPEGADFLRHDITNLAYHLIDRPRVAIIGVGGGRDILSALAFGRKDITAVEINPILVDLLSKQPPFAEFAGLKDEPGLRLVTDEARSWFARSPESFDLIQMSMIDTWAATGAGAFTLSENGLYTVEAWQIFMSHLSPRGVLTVSRWYAPGAVNETGRMISVTAAALMRLGVTDPRRHLFLAAGENIATLVASRSEIAPEDVARLRDAVGRLGFTELLSPDGPPATEVLARIVEARNPEALQAFTSSLALDLTPATDDRPFFFNQLPLHRPLNILTQLRSGVHASGGSEGVLGGNLVATATLLALLGIAVLLVVLTILVPLRAAAREAGRHLVIGGTLYFVLIGVGFMAVEIGMLQCMSVFLGHPTYSLSVVLFTLILATGVGSLASEFLPLDNPRRFVLWAVLTGGYVASTRFWLPHLLLACDSWPLLARSATCILILAPAGVLMGFGFPTGMRLASRIDRRPTPWFWGINGAAGVLAAILCVALSMAMGIRFTLTVGAFCYLGLVGCVAILGFGEAPVRKT